MTAPPRVCASCEIIADQLYATPKGRRLCLDCHDREYEEWGVVRLFGGRIRFEKYTRNKWLQWVGFLIGVVLLVGGVYACEAYEDYQVRTICGEEWDAEDWRDWRIGVTTDYELCEERIRGPVP